MKEVKKNAVKRRNIRLHPNWPLREGQVKGPDLKELEYEIRKDIRKKHHTSNKFVIQIVILFLLICIFVGLHLIIPKIELNGEEKIEISYHDTYVEQGATAKYFQQDLTDRIEITSAVDTNKIGTYEVIYKVNYSFYTVKKKRIVEVVDKEKPTITLEGDTEVNICPNSEFKEIGYQAIDEYDGDITEKVKIKKEKDRWIYSVKDSSGNTTSISRILHEKDEEAPTITLKGNQTMYLGLEEDFKEPGYTASDNCSGDVTNKVSITGEVKAKEEGTYKLTYQVSDDYGNTTTLERKVIVSEKTDPNSGEIKKGAIYLTFDDGPSNVTTGAILDILKEEGVKATFFVTNNGPDYLIKRMYDEGHTVGLHTASHNYAKVYASVDSYFLDLSSVSDRVKRITGQASKIVRFPGGSSNTISKRYCLGIMTELSEALFNRGYRYYDWNIDSGDAYNAKTKEAVYQNVISNLSKNRANVVLMHDIKTWTRDALRDIIRYGKENGYTFERIDMDTHMVRQKINN